MINQMLYITNKDKERLQRLLDNPDLMRQRPYLERLASRLESAQSVVSSSEVPSDCVTMNSTARLVDLDTGEEMVVTVVYPDDADVKSGRISVLAPVGMAILGGCAGEVVEWEIPEGIGRYRIDSILYQPEAAGQPD